MGGERVRREDVLLEVRDLRVSFPTPQGEVKAVNGISYTVRRGEVMGIVGESGSGKSVEAYSILGLLREPGRVDAGSAKLEGRELIGLPERELSDVRGRMISMVFQNPMSSLDPVFPVGRQMTETLLCHSRGMSRKQARAQSQEMLRSVGIGDAERLMKRYPFELSGGMRQRVMIAIALLCKPKLLIADEPTTALDVSIQTQIIRLLKRVQRQSGMAMIYITHNMGIIADLCDRVSIMYGGRIVEQGPVDEIFYRAAHPYTRALLDSIPRLDARPREPLASIRGAPINPANLPPGCAFHPRCEHCAERCRTRLPPETRLGPAHSASCWLLEDSADPQRVADPALSHPPHPLETL